MNRHIRRAQRTCAGVLLLLAGLAPTLAAQETAREAALLTGIQLRRQADVLQLQFQVEGEVSYEVVANPRRLVAVVKFTGARPAFPEGQRAFAFNDPLIEGIVFETIDARTTWAKVRLRTPAVLLEPVADPPPGMALVAVREAPTPPGIRLIGVDLTRSGNASRLVVELEQLPQYRIDPLEGFYLVRLSGVAPEPELDVALEDDRIAVLSAEADGNDTLLRIRTKQPVSPDASVLTDPARLVLDFAPSGVAAAPEPGQAERPRTQFREAPEPEPLQELLDAEPDVAVRGNYLLAEREFRAQNYATAARLFQRVHLATPRTRLGVRALFRAADAAFQLLREQNATNFHSVIESYQAAIRTAERIGYESELIPRALFNIGRAYQEMQLYVEADVHYEILQDNFPDNLPYTLDSYYYRGQAKMGMDQYEQAIAFFRQFLEQGGEPALEGPAFYHIGDAYYAMGDYTSAKEEFDQGRRISPSFADDRPLLLFHMGETYYENAEFQTARAIYRQLMADYPDRPYTKLVALRMGDFLRQEGKEADALEAYRQVIDGAEPAIRMRGKMRMAEIYAERPVGDDYKKALKLYDEVAEEAGTDLIGQEALLRKALTLTLHNRHQPAIDTFETLQREYPESPFVRPNVVEANIDENLKGLIDDHARKDQDWEVVKVYNRYRDTHLRDFPFESAIYQAAAAYHDLGLYDEAMLLYDQLAGRKGLSLEGLVQYRITEVHSDRDQLDRAEEALLRFIKDYPEDPYHTDARMLLGDVYSRARRYEDAVNAYQLIIQDYEQSQNPALGEAISEAYFRMGQVHRELGQLKEAHDAFVDAVENFHHPIQGELVPEHVILAHFLRADMLFEMNEDAQAMAAYEDAIARYPEHERTPWAWYQIGLIHRRNGNDVQALETFNRLVEMAKERPGELWEGLAKDNQRDLVNVLQYREYLNQ